MLRRPRNLALVAAVTLAGWLTAASAANAQAPGAGGGGGMFAVFGLPSIGDVVKKVVSKVFGALADALLPEFIKEAPSKLVAWLATLPNPTADDSAVHSLMATTRATAFAFLIVVLLYGAIRGMLPGDADHPLVVLGRVVGVAFFLVIFEWLFDQTIALFNTVAVGLLKNDVVAKGIGATVERAFSPDTIGANPLAALLVLIALCLLMGLLAVKLMMLYLVPMFFVAGPLIAPLSVPRETSHIPRVMGQMFGALCAIPAGWAILFGVAGALSSDMAAGKVDGGGILTSSFLAPMTTICIFGLAVWWPWAVLGMAKSLPGQLGIATGKGPAERASGLAGTAMKVKLASMFAAGGMGALAGTKMGAGSAPRLAADQPTSTWRARSRPTEGTPGGGAGAARAAGSPGGSSQGAASANGDGPASADSAAAGANSRQRGGRSGAGRDDGVSAAAASAAGGVAGAAAASSGAGAVAGEDPLRPGAAPGAGQGSAAEWSRQAATSTPTGSSVPPSAAEAATAANRPSEGPSGAPAATATAAAAAGGQPHGASSGAATQSAAPGASRRDVPVQPAGSGQQPPSQAAGQPASGAIAPRPQGTAADRAREAVQPHAADHVAGLPARDLDTAREAFGKDPS